MPFPNIGPGELILILVIALVVLGPGKLPDVAASLGKSVREFRRAATDVTEAGKLDAAPSSTAPSTAPSTAASVTPAAAPDAPTPAAPAVPAVPAATPVVDATRPSDGAPNAGEPARDPNVS